MRRTRKQQHLNEAEINLTPLIDVCFVILIMFIFVAPLLETERVQLASAPPLDEQKIFSTKEQSPVTIYVFADDTIAVNKQNVALSQLKDILAIAQKKHPSAKPQLFHDRNAKFGTYQSVKNALEAAGFSEMDLILKPE